MSLLTCRWIPESARWLLANGKVEEAKKYLVQCARMNGKHSAKLDSEVRTTVVKSTPYIIVKVVLFSLKLMSLYMTDSQQGHCY